MTTFATWNEANHCGQPTCHRPQLVAAYYRAIRRECPKCTILAAETLDMPNMASWIDAFQEHLGPRDVPRYWGLRNYIDANRMRTSGTQTMIKHAKGQIWFTETGGIVGRRNNKAEVGFPESAARGARDALGLRRARAAQPAHHAGLPVPLERGPGRQLGLGPDRRARAARPALKVDAHGAARRPGARAPPGARDFAA